MKNEIEYTSLRQQPNKKRKPNDIQGLLMCLHSKVKYLQNE